MPPRRGSPGLSLMPPAGLLARTRWLFLLLALLTSMGGLVVLIFDGSSRRELQLAGIAGLPLLCASWVHTYRRGRFSKAQSLAQPVAVFAALIGCSDPLSVCGVAYATILFTALFNRNRLDILLSASSLAAFVAALLLSPEPQKTSFWAPVVLVQVPAMVLCSYIMSALRSVIARQQETFERERVLSTVGGQLVAATDRSSIFLAASDAVHQIVGDGPGVRTSLALGSMKSMRVLAAHGHDAAALHGVELKPYLLRDDIVQRLARRETLGHDEVSPRDLLADHLMKRGHFFVVPLVVRETLWGVLCAESDAALGADCRDAVESLGSVVTLALEAVALRERMQRQEMERQVRDRSAEAEKQALERLNHFKDGLLDNVAHELRTPLTSIRSFSELLLSYEDDHAVNREFLEIINNESERLTRLVNDVLDLTKVHSGSLRLAKSLIDLPELLEEAARIHAPLIRGQGLDFRLHLESPLPVLEGDRDRLRQVIDNLLNNALKFTGRGSISLIARRDGRMVAIAVADSGIGIAPADQQRIFEKFQQVGDTLTDKPRGTGLGLAICRELVEQHGGRINVESSVGAGSTFTVSLPAAAARKPRPVSPPEPLPIT